MKKIVEALSKGVTYKQASEIAGINDQTLYRWLQKGRNRECPKCIKLADMVAQAESDRLITLLDTITGHAAKDWRAGAFILERRYGYTKDNNLHQIPTKPKETEIPESLEQLLKNQIADISKAMTKAQEKDSFQAYAALQRQLLTVVTQLKAIQDEEDQYNEFDNLTDEQILTLMEQSFLALPPILRQRAIDRLTR